MVEDMTIEKSARVQACADMRTGNEFGDCCLDDRVGLALL